MNFSHELTLFTCFSHFFSEEGDSEPLQCVLCPNTFPDLAQLMEHTKQHEEEHEAETQAIAQAQAFSMINSPTPTCLLCDKNFTLRLAIALL